MAKKNKIKHWSKKKINNKLFISIIIILFIFCISIVYAYTTPKINRHGFSVQGYIGQLLWPWTHPPITEPLATPTRIYPTQNPNPSVQPIQISKYTSSNLGISFHYPAFIPIPGSALGGQAFFVREIGNKIYLYDNYNSGSVNKPFTGSDNEFLRKGTMKDPNNISSKYLEVFYKNPQQSLTDAIKQQIFQGDIPSQCYIKTSTRYGEPSIDESYEHAVIWEYTSPKSKTMSYQENINYILSCTRYASNYIGLSYFLMDPKHPDRFLYISDGQDNIPSGIKGYTWDGTITFLTK